MDSQLRSVVGSAYAIVGTNEDDPSTPLVTVESPMEVHVDLDPRTRKVRAALKRQFEPDDYGYTEAYATLYLPNETRWYSSDNGGGTWSEIDRDEHGMGEVPSSRSSTARAPDAAAQHPRGPAGRS